MRWGLVIAHAKADQFQDGDWVRVFGSVKAMPKGQKLPGARPHIGYLLLGGVEPLVSGGQPGATRLSARRCLSYS